MTRVLTCLNQPYVVTTCPLLKLAVCRCIQTVSVRGTSCTFRYGFHLILITKTYLKGKMTHKFTSLNLPCIVTTCHLLDLAVCCHIQKVQVNCSSCTFDSVCFINASQERKTASPGNHFIAAHFPNDKGWRWNDESWNDMISLAEFGASRQKTGSLCSAAVSVLPEPWNNDPSLLISVYSVNHNTSEMSLAFRRRTIDLVCALPHQRAVTGLHPNWGN